MPSLGVGVICALALPLLALSGCSLQTGSGLTASQARVQFYSALDQTQAAVGGAWDVYDDPTARGCVISLWNEGEQFPGLRIGSAPRDPQATVNDVNSAWLDLGYTVVRSRIGPVIQLQGRGKHNESLVFRVSSTAMTLQGESECSPKTA